MKFSIKYSLAFIIMITITMFVFSQALFSRLENETVMQNISKNLNPFWKSPNFENKKFEEKFQIPVTHNGTGELLVNGKIKIFDENNFQLKNIGVIGQDENSVGTLTDYILINPLNETIPNSQTKIFEVHWLGIGDKYIDSKTSEPKIEFNSPIFELEKPEIPDIHFWQKPVLDYKSYNFIAKAELSSTNTVTNEIINQNPEDIKISIKYPYFKTEINTGLLIILATLVALTLVFREIISRNKQNEKINLERIKNIEKFAEESIQAIKNTKTRKISKKTKSDNTEKNQ